MNNTNNPMEKIFVIEEEKEEINDQKGRTKQNSTNGTKKVKFILSPQKNRT